MSRLQTAADYERELAELDAMIVQELADLERAPDDFSAQLSLRSLEQRRAELRNEMAAAAETGLPGEEFDLIFKGGPVHQNRLAAEFMGNVLVKLQKLVTSMLAGERSESALTGPIKNSIRKASELQFAGSFAGSFGMRLEAIPEQPDLDGSTPLGPTLQAVVELLEAKDNPEMVLERVSRLNVRAAKDYTELIGELSSNEADMRVVWPRLTGETEVSLRSNEAKRLRDILKDVHTETSGRYYWGKLDISNRRHGRFGFQTDQGEIFDGTVEEQLIPDLRLYYDQHCKAWIETKVVRHLQTGLVRRSHRLQELELAPEQEVR